MRGMENRQSRILNLIDKIIDDGSSDAVQDCIQVALRNAYNDPEQRMLNVLMLSPDQLKITPEIARKSANIDLANRIRRIKS